MPEQLTGDQLDVVQHPILGTLKFPKDMPYEERNDSIDRVLMSRPDLQPPPGVARPQVDMQPQLAAQPWHASKVPSDFNPPDSVGQAIGGLALGGLAAMGGAQIPGVPALARAAYRAAPYVAASEGINRARQIPYVGKFIPPGAEIIPWFLGGKGKVAAAEGKIAGEGAELSELSQQELAQRQAQSLKSVPQSSRPMEAAPESLGEPPQGTGVQNAPHTLSGESALLQILTGQDNKNLLKIARSRGINVAPEAVLKPGVADAKLIKKIMSDFMPDELDEIRSQYIENTRLRPPVGDIGPEAWKTLSMQTFFPEVKVPATQVARTHAAMAKAKSALVSGAGDGDPTAAADLTELLRRSLEQVRAKGVTQ